MRPLSLVPFYFCFFASSIAVAVSSTRSAGICSDPPKRLEWRQLSDPQKKSYIDAVLCLTKKKGISGIENAVNRFDDHYAVHSNQTDDIHWVGHFLHWHRYFVATYEAALRDECGYTDGQPYWDWSQDTEPQNPNSTKVFHTAIFDPETGFGGNGAYIELPMERNPYQLPGGTGGGCVQDGPFTPTNFMLNHPKKDCLRRDYIPRIMNTWGDPAIVAHVLAQKDFTSFARELENKKTFAEPNIHGSGHFGVGGVLGTLGNASLSPGDPLFYPHHAYLDFVFWTWQQQDLPTRLHQVGGPVKPLDYSGENVTLDFEVNIGKLAGNATLHDLLDTQE
ncbi:hypothetical protein FKW77_005021 [Venturia effusa]|uniref:Tyrosinase copper-binding domain-containing protein n=1 Tax=Venturia effusa TaxID=50376 RepID=A0A517LK50_9PEZI|nr:hypothetical protein FKW77_005021 [Venturia effusa]